MKTGQKAIQIITESETLRLETYLCPAGVRTIGYGHTGSDVLPGMKIETEEAERLLKSDLVRFENVVNKLVKVPLNQNQFDALISLVFNIGEGNFKGSTLLKKLNASEFAGAALEFPKWNKGRVKGELKVLPGLVIRREREKNLFLKQIN